MEKIQKSGKPLFVIVSCFFLVFMAACSDQPRKQSDSDIVIIDWGEQIQTGEGDCTDAEKIAVFYREICEQITETDTLSRLEIMQKIIDTFGENGYAAVDSENQIDMTNAEQVMDFCRAVDAGIEAELTIIEVIDIEVIDIEVFDIEVSNTEMIHIEAANGKKAGKNIAIPSGFRKYDFHTENGKVDIVKGYYCFDRNKDLVNKDTVSYPADLWQYTEEGYLVFAGSYYADDYYIISLTDEPEHAALRVAPLDAECRELYRKYIQSVGYEDNNLFLVNWTEEDFSCLDFYDLFDKFYPIIYQKPVPYTACENPGVGFVYRIAESQFEDVIGTYLNVSPSALRSKTSYFAEDQSYEYKPRGFYEAGCSDMPYPEVTDYFENADGTITLTVNAVFSYEGTAKAFTHEVVVRPLENGGFQYVSNQITGGEYDAWWYAKRLTPQEWEEVYNGHKLEETGADEMESRDESFWYLPQADESLLTEIERDALEDAVLAAAGQVREVYQNMEMEEGTSYTSNVKDFSDAQRKEVVTLLGKAGFVSVADNMNMQNYEKFEKFYDLYLQKQDAMETVYDVRQDGLIGALTFVYRNSNQEDKLQTYYIGIGWQEGGTPKIKNTLISDVGKMYLTQKGYLIYTYEEQIVHSDENRYLRVKPLSEKCRELTEKYIDGLSFVNYNAFITDWDSSNVEKILMPCMFEDIYRIHTGANLKAENGQIPAEVYEQIMMTYFPVSKEQLRSKCGYDVDSGCYPYEMIFAIPHAPFGEVVDYTEHADGTITLFVDGVWIDCDSDCAFTSKIVVQPFADGTFRYLSNKIQPKELELPTAAAP